MKNIFDKITKTSIYLLVFLMPLFWLPFTFKPYEFNKQYLLFFLVSIAFLAWLAKMILIDKEIRFRRTPLDLPILAFLGVAVLSALFSVDKISSLFGFYGRFSDGLIGLLSMGMFYFLIVNNVQPLKNADSNAEKTLKSATNQRSNQRKISVSGLIKTLLGSVFLVVVMSYISIFNFQFSIATLRGVQSFALSSNEFSIFNFQFKLPTTILQGIFNPVAGSMEGLAMFLAVVTVLLVGLILINQQSAISNQKQKKRSIAYAFSWILLIVNCLLLIVIDFTPAWIVLLITLMLFTILAMLKRIFSENVNKLLLPIFLIIIAFIFAFANTAKLTQNLPPTKIWWGAGAKQTLNLTQEQTLDQLTSYKIAKGAMTENIKSLFLGSGIGTFHYDFAKFKPVEFNQTNLWQIRFDRPGSHISELLATMGFLGLLSYLSVIGLFLLIFWFYLQASRFKSQIPKLQLPLAMMFLALVVAQFVYEQNTTLAFTFWLILGLNVVLWFTPLDSKHLTGRGPIKEKTVSFKNFPELALGFNIFLIIIGLTFGVFYFFAFKFYLADVAYANAVRNTTENKEKVIEGLEKAIRLNPYEPQYRITLSGNYFNQAFIEAAKEQGDQIKISDYVGYAIAYNKGGEVFCLDKNGQRELDELGQFKKKYIKGATEISPNRIAAWENLAVIYRDIQGVAEGALDWGIKSFERAIELEPNNPVFHIELGKLYLNADKKDEARGEFMKAVELKEDYIMAFIEQALSYEKEDNLEEAIRKMEEISSVYSNQPEIIFQLGRLYFNAHRVDEAISQFQRVIDLAPNYSNAYYSLGVAYNSKGKKDLAIQEFEKVLELNPDNEDVKEKIKTLKGELEKELKEAAEEESEKE